MSKPPTIHTLESLQARCIEEGECWLWQGPNNNGTPEVYHEGRMYPVRALMLQFLGKAHKGRYLSCRCGESRCIRGEHILPRTRAEHMAHLTAQANTGTAKVVRIRRLAETKRKSAKLTIEQARQIRQSDEPLTILSARFGVDRSLCGRIRRGESWREHTSVFAGLMP